MFLHFFTPFISLSMKVRIELIFILLIIKTYCHCYPLAYNAYTNGRFFALLSQRQSIPMGYISNNLRFFHHHRASKSRKIASKKNVFPQNLGNLENLQDVVKKMNFPASTMTIKISQRRGFEPWAG